MARFLAAAAAAATGVQVGSAMVATRFVVDQTGPASLALLRYIIGFGCLLPAVLLSAPRARFERRDLLPIGLLGITQFGILIALLNYGLRFIPSARAALIFDTPVADDGRRSGARSGAADPREALRGAADARGRGGGGRGGGVRVGGRGRRG